MLHPSTTPNPCTLNNACPYMSGQFNFPQIHGGASGSKSDAHNFVYFIQGLRKILEAPKLVTYTISCAPWGLHWYADAIYELDGGGAAKPDGTSDWINLMSYDYGGWWESGLVSQWLANIYTDTNALNAVW